ncbi:FAD-dependent oxidoreductase [Macrococcus epidermidis]|uniref:Type II NADH:quinone oxidoreductase n=1 Tax=Macrococcus epidermidis TaxID=1902580 RepID=A0A327ZV10_9STAP|nr:MULTISPECIES: NAD(P)/FAD-dependent oxidoreductase [Macrococcus]MCG7419385.1 NAD(P)/FAD-dependent oxidoreductase [Macrococcus epidermidis]RAK46193.1 FAD-dependent oxidoreductase [Macrococcus epidermidis]TDM41861.1 NAD(P)/FAD-dependent oxidoreductase [Macrococcus goetzii]UTH17006.1 NAD(P)/FAD-dependent oxidoreductase [Macrococcus epidermidis]
MGFERKKVVVLGGGYAGLQTVTKLQKLVSTQDCDITLINKNEYHYEATWLHEASAGTREYQDCLYPIASVLNHSKVDFVVDEVTKINKDEKTVETTNGTYKFDILVVALGFESETFGIAGMKEHAFQIENINTARRIAAHIEERFAHYANSTEKDEKDLAILVGGAGFTGIELLGELVEKVPALCKEYNIDQSKVKLTCVEAAPKMLPMFSEDLVKYVMDYLEKRGVEFKIATPIVAANENGFVVKVNEQEEQLYANTVIWAAGVRGSKLMEESFDGVKRGRIVVREDLRIDGYDDIFVIGDCSAVMSGERPLPTTAQIAMQQGEFTASAIQKLLNGEKLSAFAYDDKGTVCSLGSHDGVGVVFGKEITGKKAAFMKKLIDTRALFKIGGAGVAYKKGKF